VANEKTIFTESFVAGEDLTDNQYHGVKLNGNRTIDLIDADTDIPAGILLDEPDDAEVGLVMIVGRCPVVVGEAIVAGAYFCFDADGHAEPWDITDTDQRPAGIVTVGAAAGEVGEVIVIVGAVATA